MPNSTYTIYPTVGLVADYPASDTPDKTSTRRLHAPRTLARFPYSFPTAAIRDPAKTLKTPMGYPTGYTRCGFAEQQNTLRRTLYRFFQIM